MNMTAITPPRRTTTSDQAYDAILDAILAGRLQPGESLTLKHLSESLEMSMMPVREAVRKLEALGIIESEPYRGSRVREITTEDLIDIYRTRLLLERHLVRRAASRFTPELETAALECLDRQQQRLAMNDREGARLAHKDFHFTIYRAASAPWALLSAEPTWANSERYREVSGQRQENVARRRSEHEAILNACVAGDPDTAVAALEDHLMRTVCAISQDAAAEIADELSIAMPDVKP